MRHGILNITDHTHGATTLNTIPPTLRALIALNTPATYKTLVQALNQTHGPLPLDLVPWALTHQCRATTPATKVKKNTPAPLTKALDPSHTNTPDTLLPLNITAADTQHKTTLLETLTLPDTARTITSPYSYANDTLTALEACDLYPRPTKKLLEVENTPLEAITVARTGGVTNTSALTGPIKLTLQLSPVLLNDHIELGLYEKKDTVRPTISYPNYLRSSVLKTANTSAIEEKPPYSEKLQSLEQGIKPKTVKPVATNIHIADGAVIPRTSTVKRRDVCTALTSRVLYPEDTIGWVLGQVKSTSSPLCIHGNVLGPRSTITELPRTYRQESLIPQEFSLPSDFYCDTGITGYSLLPSLCFDDTMDLLSVGRGIDPVDISRSWEVKSYNEQVEGDFSLVDIDPRRETPDFSLQDLV